ncbi:type VI immunity family protein [Burkholderia sp. BCC0419]|uniref:type VI immunity family protein n=1 Tax=Burkholderia sp. BCC0419 TaxID=486878 RepID=UPI001589B1CB|nr:type VI immunity family protein [Burkholderia sp. BCC0419]
MDIWTQYQKYRNDLIYTSDDGEAIKLCVGLSGTFYFWHGETLETRLVVARCFERFQELFGSRLKWVLPNEDISRREVQISSDNGVPAMRDYVATMDADDLLEWQISGGRSADEASDCYMAVLTVRQWQIKVRNLLSWVNFAVPVEVVYGPEGNPKLFVDFIRFCCEQLRPWHGTAGLASLLPQDSFKSLPGEFDVQQRYFGLDIVDGTFSLGDRLQRHLKGANWLTMFDKEFPATITREQWQTLDTTPGIQIWKAGRTYVLQAGEQPTLGPVPDGIPPLYKIVSDIIKPMRLTPMRSFHIGSMTGAIHFNGRTSELWSQRFDAPGIWPPYPDQIEFNHVDTSIDEYAAQPFVQSTPQPPAKPPRTTVLRALPGQPCPQEGNWFSPFMKELVHVKLGDPMPGPETTEQGAVTWYLRTE